MTKDFLTIKPSEKALYKEIERLCQPIFSKVLQEIDLTRVQPGKSDKDKPVFTYVKAHNYRRWYDFNKATFNPAPRIKNAERRGMKYKLINSGHEHFFEDYYGCNIKVKKTQIEVQNKIDIKWISVDIYRSKEQVINYVKEKEIECIYVLKKFLNEFGGRSKFNLLKHKEEMKVENNAITEKIAAPLTWHHKHHKKVYSQKQIETYDIVHAIQLIDNSIFYQNAQEIAAPLKMLGTAVKQMMEKKDTTNTTKRLSQSDLKNKIKTKEDLKKYSNDIMKLNTEEKINIMKYCLLELGILGKVEYIGDY